MMAVRDIAGWLESPPQAAAMTDERAPGAFGQAMLWAGLSMSILAFVPGAYLVPALGLREAILTAIAGSLAGGAMLAAVAWLAARQGKTSVGLLESTLGVPAGTVLAALLLLRHVLWAIFALAFAARVAESVPSLGGSAALWGVALGALALALALLPQRTFVRIWIGRFAFWVGFLLIALVTITGISSYGIPVLHDADGLGGWPNRAQGFDLIAALPLLWLPVVADYARDASSPRAAAVGTGVGAGVMTAWYSIIGLLWVFTVSASDVAGFITALPIGAAGILIVIALEPDAVAANLYAASMAGGRFGYRWFRPALLAAAIVTGAAVVATDALGIEDGLQALSTIFVPLFAAVLVRGWRTTPYWAAWAAWALGALAYGWINPGDFAPWRDAMEFVFKTLLRAPFPLGDEITWLPASVAAFALAAAFCWAASIVAGDRAARRA
jgi:purine-cytosine permease-like protein